MKYFLVVALALVAMFAAVQSTPVDEVSLDESDSSLSDEDFDIEISQSRITCDLLSPSTPWGSINHAACAAHCLAKRYKGGRCVKGVCRCRK